MQKCLWYLYTFSVLCTKKFNSKHSWFNLFRIKYTSLRAGSLAQMSGKKYFGRSAAKQREKVSLQTGYWFLNYAPFKVSRSYPIGAKQMKSIWKEVACADVMPKCIRDQIRSETNTKDINLHEADHFHFVKRQKYDLLWSVQIKESPIARNRRLLHVTFHETD